MAGNRVSTSQPQSHGKAETGEALAASLDELNTVAQRHLDYKEQKIDPLAAATATQEKRNALNEHAAAEIQWTSGGSLAGALPDL